MKKLYIIFLAAMLCLSGCSDSKGFDSKDIIENLTAEGIPESAVREKEKELYHQIDVRDAELGYATIYVYHKASDAEKYWSNLEENYNNLQYSDDATAVGDVKDVCDASIEEWIHYEDNVIITVEQYVANEWAVYVDEKGEAYYGDGTKVSDVELPDKKREKAYLLENKLRNSLRSN